MNHGMLVVDIRNTLLLEITGQPGIMVQNLRSLVVMLIANMTRGGHQAASPVRAAEEVEAMTRGCQAASPKRAAEEVELLEINGIPTAVVSAAAFQVMNGGVLDLSQINLLLEDLNRARAPRDATKTPTRVH